MTNKKYTICITIQTDEDWHISDVKMEIIDELQRLGYKVINSTIQDCDNATRFNKGVCHVRTYDTEYDKTVFNGYKTTCNIILRAGKLPKYCHNCGNKIQARH